MFIGSRRARHLLSAQNLMSSPCRPWCLQQQQPTGSGSNGIFSADI